MEPPFLNPAPFLQIHFFTQMLFSSLWCPLTFNPQYIWGLRLLGYWDVWLLMSIYFLIFHTLTIALPNLSSDMQNLKSNAVSPTFAGQVFLAEWIGASSFHPLGSNPSSSLLYSNVTRLPNTWCTCDLTYTWGLALLNAKTTYYPHSCNQSTLKVILSSCVAKSAHAFK